MGLEGSRSERGRWGGKEPCSLAKSMAGSFGVDRGEVVVEAAVVAAVDVGVAVGIVVVGPLAGARRVEHRALV